MSRVQVALRLLIKRFHIGAGAIHHRTNATNRTNNTDRALLNREVCTNSAFNGIRMHSQESGLLYLSRRDLRGFGDLA
jgi:hypothetical protein